MERLDAEKILSAAKAACIAMEDRLTALVDEQATANDLAHTLAARGRAIEAGQMVAVLYQQAPGEYAAAREMLAFRWMPENPLPVLQDITAKGDTWAQAAQAELSAGGITRHLGPEGGWVEDQTPAQVTALVQTGLTAYRDSFGAIGLPPQVGVE